MVGRGDSTASHCLIPSVFVTMPFRFNREGAAASLLLLKKKEQGLQGDLQNGSTENIEISQCMQPQPIEIQTINCTCCGISEDCTITYINLVREQHCGEWICGLCSEAAKELRRRNSAMSMQEAMESQKLICNQFNKNIRLNPELSFAGTMRDIARRSFQRRTSEDSLTSKVSRSVSCGARFHN